MCVTCCQTSSCTVAHIGRRPVDSQVYLMIMLRQQPQRSRFKEPYLTEDLWFHISQHMTTQEWCKVAGTCKTANKVSSKWARLDRNLPVEGEQLLDCSVLGRVSLMHLFNCANASTCPHLSYHNLAVKPKLCNVCL